MGSHVEYRECDAVSMAVDGDADAIESGDALVLVGDRTVRRGGDVDGESAIGIAGDASREHPLRGTHVTCVMGGGRNANVTPDVRAGDTLVCSGDQPGKLRPTADGEEPRYGFFTVLAGADSHESALVRL